jgi:chromosome segregation ATPase
MEQDTAAGDSLEVLSLAPARCWPPPCPPFWSKYMALSDLMTNLDQQIREHTEARSALDAGTAALEEMRRLIQQRQADLDTESAKEKSELEDVRSALQSIRDEADRQLASLTTGQGSATTTSAAASTKRAGASVHQGPTSDDDF